MKVCIACGFSFATHSWSCPQCEWAPKERGGFLSFLTETFTAADSFDAEYFPSLYQLEKDNFWFQYRKKLVFGAIDNFFPGINKVLDIGCGTGFVLSELGRRYPGLFLTGSDLFVEGLRLAKTRLPSAALYQMDACHMPFDAEFDLILALDIIEHIEADFKALNEISRSLKPGGGLIITVPQHQWLWSKQDEKAYHRRRYLKRELVSKIKGSGLNVLRTTSFLTLLLPLMVFSRIYAELAAKQKQGYDPLRELKIHPAINNIMRAICSAEEYILNIGARFSVGGSLLCVAKKGH